MPEGTTDGRRYHAGVVLPHSWSGLPDRGPFEQPFVGNTHFFGPPDDRRQRHMDFVLLLQDLLEILISVDNSLHSKDRSAIMQA